MKLKNRILVCAVFVLGVFALALSASTTSQASHSNAGQKQVRIESLALPNQAVSFDSATVSKSNNQDVLNFSVANRTNVEITRVQAVVFTVNAKGKINGGQGFVQDMKLAPGTTEAGSVLLHNKIGDGERLILTAWNIDDSMSGRVFQIEGTELVKSVKRHLLGEVEFNHPTRPVGYVNAAQQTYCSAALNMAQSACGCGVASFSCNESGNFSFSCNAQSVCPVQPPQS